MNKILFLPLKGLFPPGQGATIGVDFMIKTVEINGEKVKVRPFVIIVALLGEGAVIQ